jgi:hypothetical protein
MKSLYVLIKRIPVIGGYHVSRNKYVPNVAAKISYKHIANPGNRCAIKVHE